MGTKKKAEVSYDKVVTEILGLFIKKAQDYGTAWRILRIPSLTDQIFIKAQRVRTLQQIKESRVGEGMRPEFVGIANYSAMALVQTDRGVADSPDITESEAMKLIKKQFEKARKLRFDRNHEYEEIESIRISSITDLILMKLLLIKQIEDGQGESFASENIEEIYLKMINCSVIAIILTDTKATR